MVVPAIFFHILMFPTATRFSISLTFCLLISSGILTSGKLRIKSLSESDKEKEHEGKIQEVKEKWCGNKMKRKCME